MHNVESILTQLLGTEWLAKNHVTMTKDTTLESLQLDFVDCAYIRFVLKTNTFVYPAMTIAQLEQVAAIELKSNAF